MADVRLTQVVKSYGQTPVVRGIDLTVADGEIVALLGGSGCGKTTTLRMIAGLEVVSGGEIAIGGRTVAGPGVWVPPEKRQLGMVFQSYAVWPHLDVFENVAFPLRMSGNKDVTPRVTKALDAVRLSPYARRRPDQLSGGQQQRVAIARALVAEPAVLLLDEPLSNLDANLRLELREEIRALVRAIGVTVVLVTHDHDEAVALADRIALLDRGTLVQVGPARELYDSPRRSEVARFFGAREVLSATRVPGGARVGDTVVSAWGVDDAPSEGPCELAFRSSDAFLAAEGIPGVVADVAWRGHGHRVVVQVGDQRVVVEGGGEAQVGASVYVGLSRSFALPVPA